METESITREEFDAIHYRGGKILPETIKALALVVGSGMRFKNHTHKAMTRVNGHPTGCSLQGTIKTTGKRAGLELATRHDGPDLCVFRLK